jgi:hypothetical protein
MVLVSLQTPAAFAQERNPNEGEPKHEINELQNKLHHTVDPSKENHLEGKIDALQDQRLLGISAAGDYLNDGCSTPVDCINKYNNESKYDRCVRASGYTDAAKFFCIFAAF